MVAVFVVLQEVSVVEMKRLCLEEKSSVLIAKGMVTKKTGVGIRKGMSKVNKIILLKRLKKKRANSFKIMSLCSLS